MPITHGLYRKLMAGSLQFDDERGHLLVVGSNDVVRYAFPYARLSEANAWGQVYEVFVGRTFEARGHKVVFRGASLGYMDLGVDLVVSMGADKLYLQCKHLTSCAFGKQGIEKLLYSASRYLSREYVGRMLQFRVVVPSLSVAFGRKTRKDRGLYWLAYLQSKNAIQSKVRVDALELPMPIKPRPLPASPEP